MGVHCLFPLLPSVCLLQNILFKLELQWVEIQCGCHSEFYPQLKCGCHSPVLSAPKTCIPRNQSWKGTQNSPPEHLWDIQGAWQGITSLCLVSFCSLQSEHLVSQWGRVFCEVFCKSSGPLQKGWVSCSMILLLGERSWNVLGNSLLLIGLWNQSWCSLFFALSLTIPYFLKITRIENYLMCTRLICHSDLIDKSFTGDMFYFISSHFPVIEQWLCTTVEHL